MARTRSFDEDAALDAISDVFWRKGFEGTSYADLMAASGLGKGSLYAAFGDKAALYRATLQRYVDAEMTAMAEVLQSPDVTPMAALTTLLSSPIDAVEKGGDRRGCFLCNAAVDMSLMEPEVRKIVDDAFAALVAAVDGVARAAGAGQGQGAHLFSVFLGLRVMARAGAPLAMMRASRDAALNGLKLN